MRSPLPKRLIVVLSLVLGVSITGAQTVTIGPSGQYATPCAAFPHLTSGETVLIDANGGTPYQDTSDCTEKAPNVTITSVNGRPIIDGSNGSFSKAMWVIDGHDIVIDNIEFSNVRAGQSNAEDIRIENGTSTSPNGGNITIQRSYLHDSNEGVLSNSGANWSSASPYITFQYDEFANNGDLGQSGSTHNMYISGGDNMNFTLQYSWSHDSYVGHTVKTRAPIDNLYYNLIGDAIGNTSYVLDFPRGGSTYVVGNSLYKAAVINPNANENMIMWRDMNDEVGNPGFDPVNQDLHVINNTVIDYAAQAGFHNFFNEECSTRATVANCGTPPNGPPLTVPGVFENNIFLGQEAQVTNDTAAYQAGNVVYANTAVNSTSLAALHFNNAAAFDYRLLSSSPAIQAGIYPPTDNSGAADPAALATNQYVIPMNGAAWPTPSGTHMDAGAFPYQTITTPNLNLTYTSTVQSPNGGTITVSGLPTPAAGQYNYAVFESSNRSAIPTIESAASSTGTVTTTFQANPVATSTVVPIQIYVDGTVLTANVTVNPGPAELESITKNQTYYPQTRTNLYGPGTNDIVVSLSSSDPSILWTPDTVTIPAGQLSAGNGTMNGSLWAPALSGKTVTLTGTYNGKSVQLTTKIYSPGIHSFSCTTCTAVGGATVPLDFSFSSDTPVGGVSVSATSNNSAAIPSQSFPVAQGLHDTGAQLSTNSVSAETKVTLTLSFNGQTQNSTVTLEPSNIAITATSGSGQSSPVGTQFANKLAVSVMNGSNPVSGVIVTFSGTGVSFPNGNTSTTGTGGGAAVYAKPTQAGPLTIYATVSGASNSAVFSETGTSTGTPASVAVVSGSGQSAALGTPFSAPLVAVVEDSSGNPVSGVTVSFAGTNVSFPNGATATTGSNGQASVAAEPTASGTLTVTASVAGVSTPATFSETGAVGLLSITRNSTYGAGTTVNLNGTTASPVVVTLTSSDQSILYSPASVTIPAGASSASTGTLLGSLWGQSPSTKSATLTASANGTQVQLSMPVYYASLHAFTPNSSVVGGQPLGFFMETSFSTAPYGGGPYTVSSDQPSIIPTQNFTLAAGTANDFGKSLVTNAVTASTIVHVTLNYNGATITVPVTVTP